ncbi:hypothetical protein HNY73_012992 [Argiope bruennichi]|uniref:Uncharacterized protein n=1 Tax=Argiope bruennichi TaxID=94029 RepID=A0A8T0EYR9_ARGBR|nr:hypothetical protein HNY73_012992 [Argiope bruennichi]
MRLNNEWIKNRREVGGSECSIEDAVRETGRTPTLGQEREGRKDEADIAVQIKYVDDIHRSTVDIERSCSGSKPLPILAFFIKPKNSITSSQIQSTVKHQTFHIVVDDIVGDIHIHILHWFPIHTGFIIHSAGREAASWAVATKRKKKRSFTSPSCIIFEKKCKN